MGIALWLSRHVPSPESLQFVVLTSNNSWLRPGFLHYPLNPCSYFCTFGLQTSLSAREIVPWSGCWLCTQPIHFLFQASQRVLQAQPGWIPECRTRPNHWVCSRITKQTTKYLSQCRKKLKYCLAFVLTKRNNCKINPRTLWDHPCHHISTPRGRRRRRVRRSRVSVKN